MGYFQGRPGGGEVSGGLSLGKTGQEVKPAGASLGTPAMRGGRGGAVPGPEEGPKDTEGFLSGRDAASGIEETWALEFSHSPHW